MYSIGDVVAYGTTGVCRIDGECEQKAKDGVRKYLVLKPMHQANSTVYVPMDNENLMAKLKKLLTREDIENIISAAADEEAEWISNDTERVTRFREILNSGDRYQLMRMVRVLYKQQCKRFSSGKRLHASDETLFREAERILFDEFAVVLGIPTDKVMDFIAQKFGEVK
ncbi:MAG: CarD family transcriptional regulator [Hominimerdicola sp.]